MMKLKNIRAYLDKNNITYSFSEDGQHLILPACAFDDENDMTKTNFFDYNEAYKKPRCYNTAKFWKELFNDPRIIIRTCDECCGCAGW